MSNLFKHPLKKRSPFHSTEIHNTQLLAALVCAAGTGIIALKAKKQNAKKRGCAAVYKKCINDEWTEFLEDVCETCFNEWEYLIPEDKAGRRRIKELCSKTLAFENHFLTLIKDWFLAELNQLAGNNKLRAAQWFGKIVYPDAEVLKALQALESDANEELQQAIKETLERIHEVQGVQ